MNKRPLKTDFGRGGAVTVSLLDRWNAGDAKLYRETSILSNTKNVERKFVDKICRKKICRKKKL